MKIQTSNETEARIVRAFYDMRAGVFYRVQWTRTMKVRKSFAGVVVLKTVTTTVKAGIEYDNRAAVQAKRETGELPAVNAGLPWGEWYDYPRVIAHKGQYYLRLYPAPESGHTTEATYWAAWPDAQVGPITADKAREYCLASEFNDGPQADCFTVKLANLVSLARIAPTIGNEVKPSTPGYEHTAESKLATVTLAELRDTV